MEVIGRSIAKADLDKWLDFQNIDSETREAYKNHIGIMTSAIQNGRIIINADNTVTQKLIFPIGKEAKISELTYTNSGLPIGSIADVKETLSEKNDNRNSIAHIVVATNVAVEMIQKMSSKDLNTACAIIIFFMV